MQAQEMATRNALSDDTALDGRDYSAESYDLSIWNGTGCGGCALCPEQCNTPVSTGLLRWDVPVTEKIRLALPAAQKADPLGISAMDSVGEDVTSKGMYAPSEKTDESVYETEQHRVSNEQNIDVLPYEPEVIQI